MQPGCGVYVTEVRNRRYAYFWHYEDAPGGRRRQRLEYMGPADGDATAARLRKAVEEYLAKAAVALEAERRRILAEIAAIA
ncbi:MAG: hypothetical protein A3K65_07615 [Euryarchaeota archaeon RBG_16_68_12]|nr:MAG: hypothetical protein A3K65_07615 [Euryarchaeota archaeon RBG_16_68_12]